VTQWGGRGKEMQFNRQLAQRWDRARSCRRNGGHPLAALGDLQVYLNLAISAE
jgi:hypothetical protein